MAAELGYDMAEMKADIQHAINRAKAPNRTVKPNEMLATFRVGF